MAYLSRITTDNTGTTTIYYKPLFNSDSPTPAVQSTLVKEAKNGMVVFQKENGEWVWLSIFTNSFQDSHGEWLVSGSHVLYADAIEKGLVDLPELWLWHEPLWKVGKADIIVDDVVDDDTVFVLAAGHFDPDKEWIAPILASTPLANSHQGVGMKAGSDFLAYVPFEITALPPQEAANKLTAFTSWQKERNPMSISKTKRDKLAGFLGVDPSELEALEGQNAEAAQAAKQLGLVSKEATAEVQEQEAADTVAEGASTDAVTLEAQDTEAPSDLESETEDPLPIEELRKEIAEVMSTVVATMTEMQKAIGEIQSLYGPELERLSKAVSKLDREAGPAQNKLAAAIFQELGEARVAKEDLKTPTETEPNHNIRRVTGDLWLDSLLTGSGE